MRHRHDTLAAAYGFGLFPLPRYRPARRGEWRVETHMPSLGDGYLGASALEARAVLRRSGKVWMSTGLLERESHAWHVQCARGVVVTAGLGIGMYVYAAAMKETVSLVIAAEICPDVIGVMQQASEFEDWPCRSKIVILQADALGEDFPARVAACTGGRPIDYLYADIWPTLPAAEAPAQTAAIARRLRPKAAGWWGQELSFARHRCLRQHAVDEAALLACLTDIGIPAPAFTPGYVAFCRDAIVASGLWQEKPLWRRLRERLRAG